MLLMYPDIKLSRRATIICIFDEQDRLLWSGKSLLDALAWLQEQQAGDFVVVGEEFSYRLTLSSVGASTLTAG